jgi:hypothetical protein
VAALGLTVACGLATLELFVDEREQHPALRPHDGAIAVPAGPGLLQPR